MPEQVRVEGLRELQRDLRRVDTGLPRELRQAGLAAAEVVAQQARVLVPVRSGRLQRTIKARAQQRGASVKAGTAKTVPYAGVTEFGGAVPAGSGTAHHTPRPFMYPALEQSRDRAIDRYTDAVRALISRVFS